MNNGLFNVTIKIKLEVFMHITDKLTKPILEVNYLRAENVERYRLIIRYFYEEHEKIHYWLHKEDVFQTLMDTQLLSDYTPELCQADLNQLVLWNNLTAIQDTTKVSNIEEFKNRKFRYQLSDYTIEIERMAIRLEHLEVEGASLEPSLLERIHQRILELPKMKDKKPSEVSAWWNDLNNDFIRLNRNYQDYIKTLNDAKAEEMMKTSQFLIFKERIIQYLRDFVKGLQEQAIVLEDFIQQISKDEISLIIEKIVEYEMSIPRIDRVVNKQDIIENCYGRWESIYDWFVGINGFSEVNRMSDITNDIIRRITRYAQQIGELHNQGANRKEEYRHIAHVFEQCSSIYDAHKMAAMVFGVETPLHLKNLNERETDSIDSGVYDEAPTFYSLEPRTRMKRFKSKRMPASDYQIEIQIEKQARIDQMKKDREILEAFIHDDVIDFATLPSIDSYSRRMLLLWLTRGLSNKNLSAKCEWGEMYTIDNSNKNMCKVSCEDGDFYMPSFKICFKRGKNT